MKSKEEVSKFVKDIAVDVYNNCKQYSTVIAGVEVIDYDVGYLQYIKFEDALCDLGCFITTVDKDDKGNLCSYDRDLEGVLAKFIVSMPYEIVFIKRKGV